MIIQQDYEYFRDSIDDLISGYREKLSLPIVTDWKEYESSYRSRLKGIALELRGMIDLSSNIAVEESGTYPLLDTKEKVFIILVKEIFQLRNRRTVYLLPLLGIEKDISYKTVKRLYSDPIVVMILNNLFVGTINRKGTFHRHVG